jgi:hypothetical protein
MSRSEVSGYRCGNAALNDSDDYLLPAVLAELECLNSAKSSQQTKSPTLCFFTTAIHTNKRGWDAQKEGRYSNLAEVIAAWQTRLLGTRVQIRSATLINRLSGRDALASKPLDHQVKVA